MAKMLISLAFLAEVLMATWSRVEDSEAGQSHWRKSTLI